MATLSLIAQLAAAALMAGIALRDAKQFRSPNAAVLAMLALYLVAQGALQHGVWIERVESSGDSAGKP